MKKIILFTLNITLAACTGANTQTGKNNKQESCMCETTKENNNDVFATDITIKDNSKPNILSFHCADIDRGTASVSDENGENEHDKAIYDIRCVSSREQTIELSEDFKYFTDIMQSQEDFFRVLKGAKKHFFEFTLEKRKVKSIVKLDIE